MFKLLKKLSKRDYFFIAICVVLIAVQVFLDFKIPDYVSEITKLLQTNTVDVSKIWLTGAKMLLCAFGSLIGAVVTSVLAAKVASRFGKNLRKSVYEKVESFSLTEMKKFSVSSLITRTTNDVQQVQQVTVMGVQLLVKAPLMAIWSIIIISQKAWQWSLATIVAILAISIMLVVVVIFAVPRFKKMQKLTDKLNSVTRESLDGVRVVRAYNAEDYQEKKFAKANDELTTNNVIIDRTMAILSPGMSLVSNGLQLAIYWIGALLITQAGLNSISVFSDMVVYISYAMRIVSAFIMLIFLFMMVPRASVSAKRINEVLDTDLVLVDGKNKLMNEEVSKIEFKNVSFKYPDAKEYVVEDVSFTAMRGETIAFIGSTGSGKSTLINLLPRFYDTTDGEILIDGLNIKDIEQKDLHNMIGYVPQKAVLFAGDIKSNIDFGESKTTVDDKAIDTALTIAQAKDFVYKKEDNIHARVAQNGTNFSGGQKQRLAIARAIARKPEIYIFDDSFSALDYKTDKLLRKKLKKSTKNAITFIVAQRIGTIIDADKIIVLEQGKVVGIGTHDELLKTCNVYQEIAYSQFSKKELEDEK